MPKRYIYGEATPDGGIVTDVREREVFVRYPDGRHTWVLLASFTTDVPEPPATTHIPEPPRTMAEPKPRRRGRR